MEHIEITTRLMRNAEQHSRVSAPTLLASGLVSTLSGIALSIYLLKSGPGSEFRQWPLTWLGVMLFNFILMLIFSGRYAKASGQKLLSPGFKFILRSIAAPILVAIVLIIPFTKVLGPGWDSFCAPIFITLYALAILSIRIYSPKSLRILATLLLAFGCACWLITWQLSYATNANIDSTQLANFYMIFGFGLLHIITGTGSLMFERSQLPPLKK